MDGRRGYIATVKKDGFGDLDLYEILQAGVYENNLVVYDGIVSDINNNIPEDLIITVRDVKTEEFVGIYRPNKKDGRYLLVLLPDISYEIAYEAAGHLVQSIEHTPTKDDVNTFANNFLPIELDPVLLQAYLMHDFVYFDEGDMELDDAAVAILDTLVAKSIEWNKDAGHMIVNLNLPIIGADPVRDKKRSEAIINYLVSQKIEKGDIYLNGSYPQGYNDVYGLDMRERRLLIVDNGLPLGNNTTATGETVEIENILFDFDKFAIMPIYVDNLNRLAEYLNDNPDAKIEVGGHTDWLGSNEYNYLLSYRRSKEVKDYLVAKGNKPENIITAKYGEENPLANNTTANGQDNPLGRKYNRRAEFKVLSQGSVSQLFVKPLKLEQGEAGFQTVEAGKKYTIQIFALKNQKPIDFFADLVGVKLQVSDDGWYRYYVGEFDDYQAAKIALDNLKAMGYNPFIRKLSFFQK
jgi:outer membrane protein OmpA-like peptidoglycan-associated protein